MKKVFFLLIVVSVCIVLDSCSSSQQRGPSEKITFDLSEFTEDGLRERPKGEFNAISYEFCIPASEDTLNRIRTIDSTVSIFKKSKGRSGCSDKEWLCIGHSHQAGFKKVILKLASLKYIRKISETFWE